MKKNLLLLAFTTLVCLVILEVILRYSHFKPWIRTVPGGSYGQEAGAKVAWAEAGAELGWVMKSGRDFHYRLEKDGIDVVYRANKDGFRDEEWGTGPDERKTVLILGDSHAFGYGVDRQDRFGNLLGDLLGTRYRIMNASMPGWGMDQMFLAYAKYRERFKPDMVVFAYYIDDQYRSLEAYRADEGLTKPSFMIEDDEIRLRTPEDRKGIIEAFKENVLGKIYVLNYIYKQFYREWIQKKLNRKIIDRVIELAREDQTKLIFVRIPYKEEVIPVTGKMWLATRIQMRLIHDNLSLHPYLRARAQTLLDPATEMEELSFHKRYQFFFFWDRHLNKLGHQWVAALIHDEITGSNSRRLWKSGFA